VSKSVVHHALEYAAAHDLAHGGAHALGVAERLFTLTSVGTAWPVLTKLLVLTFLGRATGPDRLEALARRLPALDTALVDSGARRLGRRWREALRHAASLAQRLDASWRVAREFGPLGEAERERLLRSGRARIQRESRDVGLGMALVVFVWLLMAASLALLGGR
jgi:hypothetical protein